MFARPAFGDGMVFEPDPPGRWHNKLPVQYLSTDIMVSGGTAFSFPGGCLRRTIVNRGPMYGYKQKPSNLSIFY